MVGEYVDLTSGPDDDGDDRPGDAAQGSTGRRPFVGVRFKCCDVYARVYVNRERTAYAGYCPRCSRPITLRIGPGGTDARFFEAG